MAPAERPTSYTDLVYEVLKIADQPLTFHEIFEEVNRRRPITTKNPTGTIRNALTQGRQLVSLGDRRYAYLPNRLPGSRLRLPLTEKKPANHPLVYPGEVRDALWPSFFETQKRRHLRPVDAVLPNGDHALLAEELLALGVHGNRMPDALRRYLAEQRAADGDSLLIRVIDAEAGRCEVTFEPRRRRNDVAVAARNRDLADTVLDLLRERSGRFPVEWELSRALLARGFYRADVPPDPLEAVLNADERFVDGGLSMWMLADEMTPELRAVVEDRKAFEAEFLSPAEETALEMPVPLSPLAMRARMERALADLEDLLEGREFESIDEANAFLQKAIPAGGLPHRAPRTPLERAQQTLYEAWESPSPRQRIRLARRALEISPDCADAYVLLAEETTRTARESAALYAEGVAAGRRALGEDFEAGAGDFWGILETRPFMRALWGLAQAKWAMGEHEEAIEHTQELLRLNPNDNQGVRYPLLCWLLESGDDPRAGSLLNHYRGDIAAIWKYGRALHAFRTRGDAPRSRQLLSQAMRANPHVPAYLLGHTPLPPVLPAAIGLGDESEAVYCAASQFGAWRNSPGALAWLAKQAGGDTGR